MLFKLCVFSLLATVGRGQAVLTLLSPASPTCGDTVTLRCTFTGSLAVNAARFWKKDSVNIVSGGISTDPRYTEDTSQSSSGYFDLTITSFVSSDDGNYACQNVFYTSPDTSIACTTTACNVGWSAFGTKCYIASHDEESWPGAVTMCSLFGAKLAEIHSTAEDQFLANLTNTGKKVEFWVALTNAMQEGSWKWIQSNTLLYSESYTNWGDKQPDNVRHEQNCVWLNPLYNGQWFDGHCHLAKNYICEIDTRSKQSRPCSDSSYSCNLI